MGCGLSRGRRLRAWRRPGGGLERLVCLEDWIEGEMEMYVLARALHELAVCLG